MLYPLVFKPIFQERIWGGRNIESLYGKPLPPGIPVGESWEICDRPEAQSEVLNGPLAGKTLHWLMQHHSQELMGSARPLNGRFPLLVKILDAREKLSLQVHPPASKAEALGGEPKTEMWYITQAEPGAELYVGLRKGASRAEFEARVKDGTVAQCFHRIPVRADDAMFLPSGRVHAIGTGLVIFEIQQNSDTTYRVFDWNRVDTHGKPRQLHVEQSLECIDFHDFEPEPIRAGSEAPPVNAHLQSLVKDPLFSIEAVSLAQRNHLDVPLKVPHVLAIIEGAVRVAHDQFPVDLSPGQFCLVPAGLKNLKIEAGSTARFLVAKPG